MGQSWVFVADVAVPAASMPAYLTASASPASYRDWPRDLQTDDSEPVTVADVLDDLSRVEHADVVRRDDAISVRAIVSGDTDAWLDLRTPLAAAIRAASTHGGRGELAICGWTDGDDRTVLRVTVEPGQSSAQALKGKDANALRKRAHAAVSAIEERIEAAFRKDAIELPPALAAIHADVVAALACIGDDALLAAARKSNVGFMRKKVFKMLVQHFPEPSALIDALRGGWHAMTTMEAQRVPAVALEILCAADPTAAFRFGRAYLDAGATHWLWRDAAAAAIPFDDGPRAVLAFVHAHLEPYQNWAGTVSVTSTPVVKTLVARADDAIRAEVRGPVGDELASTSESFAIARTYLLEGKS